jgi:cytochrome c553
MRRVLAIVVVGLMPLLGTGVLRAQQGAPAGGAAASVPPAGLSWAYGIAPGAPLPGAAPAAGARGGRGAGGGGGAAGGGGRAGAPAPDPTLLKVPGSTLTFTRAQVTGGNGVGPADWFPQDHPQMPDIVAKGRDTVRACSLCHYPNGKGRAENAGVAGLPVSYFLQQLSDFRSDLRKSAEPRKGNAITMANIAKGMTPEEMQQAAEYFGSMKWTPWIKMQEVAMVPKTRIQGGLYLKLEGNETEPIAGRIIEVPEDAERTEITRDPRSGFIAYAPVGSVKKGETLATTGGGGKTVSCGTCHGADLNGLGPVPGLAGRSPSYLARQMYDMQAGARHGVWTELMKPVVAKLTPEDITNIVAYVASRPAAAAAATR